MAESLWEKWHVKSGLSARNKIGKKRWTIDVEGIAKTFKIAIGHIKWCPEAYGGIVRVAGVWTEVMGN